MSQVTFKTKALGQVFWPDPAFERSSFFMQPTKEGKSFMQGQNKNKMVRTREDYE